MAKNRIELNPAQRKAVEHVHGPLLVRAGAGTGKTTVLVERICRLISEGSAKPKEILATTFTEEAAREIGKRVRKALGHDAEGVRCSTFHGVCFDLLCRNGAHFRVLDKENLWVYLRRLLDARQLPLRHFQKAADPANFLHDVITFFDRCTDELVDAARYRQYVESLKVEDDLPRVHARKEHESLSGEEIIARCREIADVLETIEHRFETENLGTFGMMITKAIRLLESNEPVLLQERSRARFLLVDEFQDSNTAQIRFAQLLAGPEANILAVGDPDQAIYRFRGATNAAFEEFRHIFPAAKSATLEQNQRSVKPILDCAYSIIQKNAERSSDYGRIPLESARELRARQTGILFPQSPVEIVLSERPPEEAYHIAHEILSRRKADRKLKWRDFAVVYRQHSHRLALVAELGDRKIPFVVLGTDVLNTGPVRDLLAFLRTIDSGDDISLFRLAVRPDSGVDLEWLRDRLRSSRRHQSLGAILAECSPGTRLLRKIKDFQGRFDLARLPAGEAIDRAITAFNLPNCEEMQAFRRFVEKASSGPLEAGTSLATFLQYLDHFQMAGGKLPVEIDPELDAVRLMSTHSAKGLEFPHVSVIRVQSASFPSNYNEPLFEFPEGLRRSPGSELPPKEDHNAEERRLFYVSITRARDMLSLHGKKGKEGKSGKENMIVPSRYLRELADDRALRPVLQIKEAQRPLFEIHANAPSEAQKAEWLNIPPSPNIGSSALSVHAVETYSACPLRYKFMRDWNLPTEPVAAMQFGAVMHRVIHEYVGAVTAGNAYSEAELLARFRAELSDAGIADHLQHELYETQGIEQLRRFVSRRDLPGPEAMVGAEQRFKIQLDGIEVVGRIDRIDRVQGSPTLVDIVDYKTGNPRSEDDADRSLQLSVYALAAAQQWGLQPARLIFHNLQDDTVVSAEADAGRIKEAERKIAEVATGIAKSAFDPKPSPFTCKRCEYRSLCPATEETIYQIKAAAKTTVH